MYNTSYGRAKNNTVSYIQTGNSSCRYVIRNMPVFTLFSARLHNIRRTQTADVNFNLSSSNAVFSIVSETRIIVSARVRVIRVEVVDRQWESDERDFRLNALKETLRFIFTKRIVRINTVRVRLRLPPRCLMNSVSPGLVFGNEIRNSPYNIILSYWKSCGAFRGRYRI